MILTYQDYVAVDTVQPGNIVVVGQVIYEVEQNIAVSDGAQTLILRQIMPASYGTIRSVLSYEFGRRIMIFTQGT